MKLADLKDREFTILDVSFRRILLESPDGELFVIEPTGNEVGGYNWEFNFYELKPKEIKSF